MSSTNNDLTQSLLAEFKRKDELIEALRDKIKAMDELDKVKNNYITFLNESVEKYKQLLKESQGEADEVIKLTKKVLEDSKTMIIKNLLR